MNGSLRTLVIVATYNERENLPRLVEEIFAQAPQVEVLVIDDASPDGTGDWCDEFARQEPRFHCLHRSGKLGLGTAVLAGLAAAQERGFDLVVNMDADFSHPPSALPRLIDKLQEDVSPPIDVVIGSRYVEGGRIENWSWLRRWLSRTVNAYARIWLRLPVRDCSGGYRGFRTACLRRLDPTRVKARGYAFFEEHLWHLQRIGARFAETPITFEDRREGASKVSVREAVSALWFLLCLGLRARWGKRT